jgi:hypothetical protein
MMRYLQRQLAQLEKRLPVPRVVLLPGDLFFCQAFDIPPGTPEGDVEGFARLQLEAAAPFPVEALAWGFVRHERARVLVYAATFERLSHAGVDDLGEAWQVLPGFVALCGSPSEVAQVRFVVTGRSISALCFDAGQSVPARVVSRPLAADAEAPEALLEARAHLLLALGRDIPPAEPGLWLASGAVAVGQDRVRFDVQRLEAGDDAPTPTPAHAPALHGQPLWDTDVRGRTFAAQTQRQRHQAHLLWLAFAGACAAVLLLILGQLGLWGMGTWTRHLREVEASRSQQVQLLESKLEFANNLESITEREMKPFAMLAAATQIKPKELYFERVESNEWNVLRLDGQAGRADQVVTYVEQLRAASPCRRCATCAPSRAPDARASTSRSSSTGWMT